MDVLVGIADTDRTSETFERVVTRIAETGDDLTVAVVDTESGESGPLERRVRATLDGHGVAATVKRIAGDAGSELVEMANSGGFDRLVVDGGERTPTGKIHLDPTTEFVVLNAETSVTIVR